MTTFVRDSSRQRPSRTHATPLYTPKRPPRRRARVLLLIGAAAIVLLLFMLVRAHGASSPTSKTATTATSTNTTSPHVVAVPASAFSAGLQPNTCLEFAPQHGNNGHTVFVDPGHGGIDTGASGQTSAGQTVYEKDMTLAVARDLLPLLRNEGYTVVLSRNADTLVARAAPGDLSGKILTTAGARHDIAARVACANAANAQILLAIHFNAANDSSVNGAETIYDAARPFSTANKRLATVIQAALLAQLRGVGWAVPDRGVQDDLAAGTPALSAEGQAYGHLLELGPAAHGGLAQPSAMPGVLVEPFFLTHPAEADVTASKQGQQDLALGLQHGIDNYFVSPQVAKA